MDISLLHAGLAAGTALAALPVILHLFMKQTPKKVVFPALRLIRERHKRSRKKLRVKNWLLLLARMALLALMALALARPTIQSNASLGDQEVPSAVGLVFDTSLSMDYKERDKTRLDLAKELAYEILKKTPSTSLVFLADSSAPGTPQGVSPAAARKAVEGLTTKAVNQPLNAAVGLVLGAVAESEKPRHEVYVLTDLARSAWDADRKVEGLEKAAKRNKDLKTFVLRLAPKEVHDVAVTEARPSSPVVTESEPLEIFAKIRSRGPATTRIGELWLDGVVREKKSVEIPADGEVDVRFTVPKVGASTRPHQGEVRVTGAPDPLAFDDARYFTFTVKPPTKVLVVSDLPIDGDFIAAAIDPDPSTLKPGTPRPNRVDRIPTAKFAEQSDGLSRRYRCIFLNNVQELGDAEWGKLSGFVRDGGGLVIGLGRRTRAESYLGATASQVLPASLDRVMSPKAPTTFGDATDLTHPLFQRYPKDLTAMLALIPVVRYWGVTPREGSRVLLSYADKAPALLERVFKGSRTGHVLLWTTPLSRVPDAASADGWNEFPSPILGYSFYLLMNQSVAHLSGTAETALNFEAGRDVIIPVDATRRFKTYVVEDQAKKTSDRLNPAANSDAVVVSAPQTLGHWVVTASGDGGGSEAYGFSVNAPVSETQFVPLEESDLATLFGGKDRFVLAESPAQLDVAVGIIRYGRELFPFFMFAILIIVTLENLLANRFHRETHAAAAAPRPAAGAA